MQVGIMTIPRWSEFFKSSTWKGLVEMFIIWKMSNPNKLFYLMSTRQMFICLFSTSLRLGRYPQLCSKVGKQEEQLSSVRMSLPNSGDEPLPFSTSMQHQHFYDICESSKSDSSVTEKQSQTTTFSVAQRILNIHLKKKYKLSHCQAHFFDKEKCEQRVCLPKRLKGSVIWAL